MADAAPVDQQAAPRLKSVLTQMLSDNTETRGFHDIFASVPRVVKGSPESAPIETVLVPWGSDFCLRACFIFLQAVCTAYLGSVALGIVSTIADVAGGSCGQDVWMVPADEACSQLFQNVLVLRIELRCLGDKPSGMPQKNFDEACGARWPMFISLGFVLAWGAWMVYDRMMKLPVKVHFHQDFFTVESWNGKNFEGAFYADVTAAKLGFFGFTLSTRAKMRLQAGGADEDDKKAGKTLHIKGARTVKLLAGHGDARKSFIASFLKYTPVSIEGFGKDATASSTSARTSILEGRIQEILKARLSDANTYKAVRMPTTADLISTVVIIFVLVLIAWYLFSIISNFVGWAIDKGQNKCLDPMRPDADMCAWWRIFVPVSVPLVNASDYINLVVVIIGALATPTIIVAQLPMEYRFHNNGLMQEVLFAGLELQTNKMVFTDDVESMEKVDGSLEKYIKLCVRTHYTIKGGQSDFTISAKFMPGEVKATLVDPSCAACCGQRQRATAHEENLISSLRDFKPGKLAD